MDIGSKSNSNASSLINLDCRIMAQVEVLDASPYKADDTISEMSSVERRELPFDRFFEHTMAYKELGNDKFKEEEYDDAIIL